MLSRISCIRHEKTDGSHTNRPFCAARWGKWQEDRKATVPLMIFFCFFSSKKKRRRFVCEPSVLCSALGKMAGGQKGNCSAVDFLLRGRFARESWRAGAADTGRDKAEEGGIPAAVFRPTTTQDVPASVRLRGCASRAYRPVFLLKRKEGVRFLFLKKRNKRHCGIDGLSEERRFPAYPA